MTFSLSISVSAIKEVQHVLASFEVSLLICPPLMNSVADCHQLHNRSSSTISPNQIGESSIIEGFLQCAIATHSLRPSSDILERRRTECNEGGIRSSCPRHNWIRSTMQLQNIQMVVAETFVAFIQSCFAARLDSDRSRIRGDSSPQLGRLASWSNTR